MKSLQSWPSKLSRPIRIAQLDNQIAVDTESVAALQKRVDAANQDITAIRSQMSSEFKPLLEFQNVSNQVFALELTIDGLDKEIDNLDMRAAGAEGKMNRFIRACKREPACKSALNLWAAGYLQFCGMCLI